MPHRLTIGDRYLVAVRSSILTVLFDVAYQAYLPSLIARETIQKQAAGFDRVDCPDRRSRCRRHPGAADYGAHVHRGTPYQPEVSES
jgi:hypothetical protein